MSTGIEQPEPGREETVVQELRRQGQKLTQKFLEATRELERLLGEADLERGHREVSASPTEVSGYDFSELEALVTNNEVLVPPLGESSEPPLPPDISRELTLVGNLVHNIVEQYQKELDTSRSSDQSELTEEKQRLLRLLKGTAQARVELRDRIARVQRDEAVAWDKHHDLIENGRRSIADSVGEILRADSGQRSDEQINSWRETVKAAEAALPELEALESEAGQAREELWNLHERSRLLQGFRSSWQQSKEDTALDQAKWESTGKRNAAYVYNELKGIVETQSKIAERVRMLSVPEQPPVRLWDDDSPARQLPPEPAARDPHTEMENPKQEQQSPHEPTEEQKEARARQQQGQRQRQATRKVEEILASERELPAAMAAAVAGAQGPPSEQQQPARGPSGIARARAQAKEHVAGELAAGRTYGEGATGLRTSETEVSERQLRRRLQGEPSPEEVLRAGAHLAGESEATLRPVEVILPGQSADREKATPDRSARPLPVELRTPNAELRTPNAERGTPNAELRTGQASGTGKSSSERALARCGVWAAGGRATGRRSLEGRSQGLD